MHYRESLVKDRTAFQNRLRRWLHELEPGYDTRLQARWTLQGPADKIEGLLPPRTSMVAALGRREVARIRELTRKANQLERDIRRLVAEQVQSLLEIRG